MEIQQELGEYYSVAIRKETVVKQERKQEKLEKRANTISL